MLASGSDASDLPVDALDGHLLWGAGGENLGSGERRGRAAKLPEYLSTLPKAPQRHTKEQVKREIGESADLSSEVRKVGGTEPGVQPDSSAP